MRLTLKVLLGGAALFSGSAVLAEPASAQVPLRAESAWRVETPAPTFADPAKSAGVAYPEPAVAAKNKETGLTLMIVGGAAFVGGLIIGDTGGTILAVGGIAVAAYGVYLYVD